MEKNYVVMTDSSADLNPALEQELGVDIIPLSVNCGDRTFLDYPDEREIKTSEFYGMLRSGANAKTAAANVETFLTAMSRHLEQGKDVLYLGFSSGLSSTYSASEIAAQELREKLMPRAAHWPLEELISALEQYPLKTRERITLEYLVIAGVNDQPEHVKQLARICARLKAKLNLIPYNPTPGTPYRAPSPEELLRFEKALWAKDITAIVRKSKGQDIEAACGQLRAAHEAKLAGTDM